MPSSLPTSHSVAFSGFRLGLPRLLGARPGPNSLVSGTNVVNLSKAPGCSPDSPIAARTRNVDTCDRHAALLQFESELGGSEMLALGTNTPWDVLPKRLLR